MPKTMISLIGEQPIPNLLAINEQQPDIAVLLYTDLTESSGVLGRLQAHLEKERKVVAKKVRPYDIVDIETVARQVVEEYGRDCSSLIFNLTGGTKTMALACYNIAREWHSPFLYLQSEGKKTRRYIYQYKGGRYELSDDSILGQLFEIEDYLKIHLGDNYILRTTKEPLEERVYHTLSSIAEIQIQRGIDVGTFEIDLFVQHINQVGIIEVKSGKAGHGSAGVKQLNNAARREYLGTYAQKILITEIDPHPNTKELAEISNVLIIQLQSQGQDTLSSLDRETLITKVLRKLGGGNHL